MPVETGRASSLKLSVLSFHLKSLHFLVEMRNHPPDVINNVSSGSCWSPDALLASLPLAAETVGHPRGQKAVGVDDGLLIEALALFLSAPFCLRVWQHVNTC